MLKNIKINAIIIILVLVLIKISLPLVKRYNNSVYEPLTHLKNTNIEDIETYIFIPTFSNLHKITTLEDIKKYIFTVEPTSYVTIEDFPLEKLASIDLSLNLYGQEPRILITHTHSQEWFIDSEIGNPYDSIVGVGQYLAEIFVNNHGISVVHDVGIYDIKDGKIQRSTSYEAMEPAVKHILKKHPTIEVIIDLHRDGVPDNIHLVTEINGKPTAKIMFFNGITKYNDNGSPVEMPHLFNPYIMENLALSLQLFLTSNEKYPGLARNNYIKPYRYSLHLKPRSMLVEVGANTNTVEEAKNAMYPLANIILEVLNK